MPTTTTKSKSTAPKKEKVEEAKTNELETLRSENESLRTQFDEMKSQMEQMAQMMNQMSMMSQYASTPAVEQRDIKVISLTTGQLVLTTTGRSDGRHYEFMNQFDEIDVPEDDLKLIIKAMPKTTINGMFFIDDDAFVRKNGLNSAYRSIMNQDAIKGFFEESYTEAIAMYNQANKAQKSILEAMAMDKCLNGEFVDANILRALEKETGKSFMDIEPLKEE